MIYINKSSIVLQVLPCIFIYLFLNLDKSVDACASQLRRDLFVNLHKVSGRAGLTCNKAPGQKCSNHFIVHSCAGALYRFNLYVIQGTMRKQAWSQGSSYLLVRMGQLPELCKSKTVISRNKQSGVWKTRSKLFLLLQKKPREATESPYAFARFCFVCVCVWMFVCP